MGTPLELVTFDASNGKFAVNQKAASILRGIPGPVAVVAVCGRARQGKSFLLNRLISSLTGSQKGFAVSPYQRPCTKGLWIYSSPIQIPAAGPGGRKYHLVLMDCEGIDAYDQTQQYSMQIFSLAVVLSSLFVYNQMGGIDESSLERLSLVSELTKRIWEKANTSAAGSGSGEGQFSPAFLWLLRDFHLQVEDEGRAMTPREYLEETLQALPGNQNQSRNQIRTSIKGLFPDRDCYALVRPLTDEQQLARMDSLPLARLRPEFQEGLQQLVDTIRVRARPKQYAGTTATGSMLAGLAEAFVAAINDGAVPVIANAWQGVVQGECYKAVEAAEEAYRKAFRNAVDADEAALDLEHQRALAAGMAVFAQLSIGSPELVAPYEARFRDAAAAGFAQVRARRLAEADAAIAAFLSDATARVSQLLREADALEAAKLVALEREVGELLERFERTARGPSKARRLQQFLQGTVLTGMAGLIRRSVDATQQAQAAAAKLRGEAEEARKQAAEARQEARSSAARVVQLDAERAEALQQVQRSAASEQAKAVQAAAAESQLKAAQATAERLSGELAEAARREAGVRADLADSGQQLTQLKVALAESSSKAQAAQEARHVEAARLAAAQQRATAAEGELAATRAQLDTERQATRDAQQRTGAQGAELARLQADLAAARQLAEEAEQRAGREQALRAADAARMGAEAAAAAAAADRRVEEAHRGQAAEAARMSAEAAAAAERRVEEAQRGQAAEVARLREQMAAAVAAAERRAQEALGEAARLQQEAGARAAQAEERGRQEGLQRVAQAERMGADLQARVNGLQDELQNARAQAASASAASAAAAAAAAAEEEERENPRKRRRPGASADMEIDTDPTPATRPEPSAPPLPAGLTPTAPASAAAARPRAGRAPARRAAAASTSAAAAARPAATPPAAAPAPAPSPASAGMASPMGAVAPPAPADPDSMNINAIKVWLTDSGYEDDVHELNSSKAKRQAWLARIKERIAQLA